MDQSSMLPGCPATFNVLSNHLINHTYLFVLTLCQYSIGTGDIISKSPVDPAFRHLALTLDILVAKRWKRGKEREHTSRPGSADYLQRARQ